MGAEVDRLEVQVNAEAEKANRALNNLVNKLDRIASSLSNISENKLIGFANGIDEIAKASAGLSNVKTTDFTRLAKNIHNITSIDTQQINRTGYALVTIAKSISKVENVSQNAQQIGELAKNIGKLGNQNVSKAIDNMPRLATAMNELMVSLSKAPAVSDNLIQITNALANFTTNMRGVQGSNKETESSLKKVSNAFSLFTGRVNKSTKSMRSFAQIAGRFYANSFAIIRAVKKGWKSVESSMDFLETVNYFEVAMRNIGDEAVKTWDGNGYESAEAYANSFSDRAKQLTSKMTGFDVDKEGNATYTGAKNLGMNPDDVMNWQATYAQMASSLGLGSESALMFSDALTRLGGDWASLKNITFDQSWNKFASALAGQSRAIRSLGIDITNATLQEYAYKYGLTEAISEMNQATKAQLRLLAIFDKSAVACGDLANTIGMPANQLRLLQQNFANLSRTIGDIFLSVVKTVLPYINGLVIAVQRLFAWIKSLLGIKNDEYNPYGGMSDDMSDLVDGAEGFGDALDDADKAAKRLKTTTLGIDELNINNPESGSASVGGVNLGGSNLLDDEIANALANYVEKWNEAFDRMENKAQQFADKLATWAKNVYTAITPFRESIIELWNGGLSKFAEFTWDSLANFYNDFLVPIGNWAFGSDDTGMTRLVNVINDGLMSIDWDRISESLHNFWIAIEPYAEQFGEGLIDFFEKVTGITVDVANGIPGFLDNLTEALNSGDPESAQKWGEALPKIAIGIIAFKGVASVIKGIADFGIALKTLSEGLSVIFGGSGVFATIGGKIATIGGKIATIGGKIATFASNFGTMISRIPTLLGNLAPFASIIAGIATVVSGLAIAVKNFIDMFVEGFSWIKEILMVLGIALAAVGTVILGVPAAIAAGIAAAVAAVASLVIVVKENWAKISEFFVGIAEWINVNVIEPVVSFFVGLGTRIQQIFEGLWIIVQAVWITVSDWFNEHVVQPLVKFFTPLYVAVTSIFKKIWSDIQLVWGKVSAWVDEHVIQPVGKLFDALSFGIKSTIQGAINSMIAGIESAINWIVDGINKIIGGFNNFVAWSAKIAGTSWGGVDLVPNVTFSRINMFANGGFPETGQLFMARENGLNEFVGQIGNRSAVANNEQIVEAVAYGVSSANREIVDAILLQNELLHEEIAFLREIASKELTIGDRDIALANRRGEQRMGRRIVY